MLKETVESAGTTGSSSAKVNLKIYSSSTRMKVFDCIANKTLSGNIPILLDSLHKQSGIELDSVPQGSSVELMARELGAISELKLPVLDLV